MKIAMLGHKRIPSREGGIEIVVEELSTRMVEQGHNVTCYNRKGHHVSGKEFDSDNKSEHKGVKLITVATLDKKGLAAITASITASIRCAFGKYDIVHFHAEGPCAMLWLPKLFGKRCIATIHGLDHQRAKWGKLASTYIMLGEKCAAKFADEIIVLSMGVKQYFKDTYNRETVLIPNGICKPEQKPAELIKQKYGIGKDEYILFLSRLVPEKGPQYLIEAYKSINTDKKLVVAGGSSDSDEFANELKALAGDDERIIFTGFVQGQMLEELYSNAYIYCLPSDLEGMPISLLEGMSYGNCCLTSDISECTDVVGNKAVSFKKSDIDDLKNKLELLCSNEDNVAQYKAKACDYIISKYNWNDIVSQTLNIYKK